ncbi:hypothetical protein [Natranaerobius thermophilus]|uniref:Uncharacterized protein n=1 Tax=Natranaerobius thermophilus (strain ATCC BAA-1301 / DSM 18059 / JW/NM-WN-LF) TaxID=457570 RepID=B2A1Q8_NATTJ|nr:hypothetical protein [Natranaerobius thermophilus]ACB86105.1 hypothetical protein Nther_2546 [Natranaerobius thermophilus JW/NM-WN-LF]
MTGSTEDLITSREYYFNRIVIHNLRAIVPEYLEDHGNITKVVFKNGQKTFFKKSYRSTVAKLISDMGYHQEELVKKYGQVINRKQGIPIPLTENDVMVQIKYRKPIGKDDGAMARINPEDLKDIRPLEADKNKSVLIFKNGDTMNSLTKYQDLITHITHGYQVLKEFNENIFDF